MHADLRCHVLFQQKVRGMTARLVDALRDWCIVVALAENFCKMSANSTQSKMTPHCMLAP